jgi:hypothetical protein
MAQMKARQTLHKSRDYDKTTIFIPRVVYTAQIKSQISTRQVKAQIKAIQTLDLSRNCPTTDERTPPL